MSSKQGDRPVVLCLAGWGFSRAVWDPVLALFGDSMTCVSEDLSELPESDSNLESLKQWSDVLMSRLPQSFCVLGWSLGGTLGLWLADQYPGRVKAVCLVSGSPCFSEKENWPGVSKDRLDAIWQSAKKGCDTFLSDFSRWQVSLRDRSAMHIMQQAILSSKNKASLMVGLQCLMDLDCRDVNCEQFYLLASNDKILPVSRLKDELSPYSVTVEEGDHALLVTKPQRVVDWALGVMRV